MVHVNDLYMIQAHNVLLIVSFCNTNDLLKVYFVEFSYFKLIVCFRKVIVLHTFYYNKIHIMKFLKIKCSRFLFRLQIQFIKVSCFPSQSGATMIIWQLDLQLPVQSMPITTKVLTSNPVHGEVYLIKHYVISLSVVFSRYSGFLNQ